MVNIKIDHVGDIRVRHNYLEVFVEHFNDPFLDISINENEQLQFLFYPVQREVFLSEESWLHIFETASQFFPKEIKRALDDVRYFGEEQWENIPFPYQTYGAKTIRIEQETSNRHEHPFLQAYIDDRPIPLMKVSITKNKELEFLIYEVVREVSISPDHWETILKEGRKLLFDVKRP